ncbi:MAG TPA: mechanosensitive ion channel family protein [Bacteriovoracaceae bacterium]|nr:mechanosensitive ion channel family protein [Bacteriovoracaceae bacterium]
MDYIILDNFAQTWIIALASTFLLFIFFKLSRRIIRKRLKFMAQKTETIIDDLAFEFISAIGPLFSWIVAIYISSSFLALSEAIREILYKVFIVTALLQAGSCGKKVVTFWVENYLQKRSSHDPAATSSVSLVDFALKFLLYTIIFLLLLHNIGVNITTLITGLGVGGIAVALAVQNILGDLFASLTIILDKPFSVGDSITVDGFIGTVERIGLKTTHLRSLSGEQLIFSNNSILQSRIRNYKRMSERRVSFTLGVVYQTGADQLEKVPSIIKEIITSTSTVRFDRCHFLNFGLSSLDIEVVYWVLNSDFNVYADIAQKINLEIFRRFQSEKIDFAYPTQTLFVQK